MYHIYKITNMIDGKSYIGKTIAHPPEKRWEQHKGHARRTKLTNHLCCAMRKYGIDNFLFEILCWGEDHEAGLMIAEPLLIDIFKPKYNMTKGGEGTAGRVLTTVTRRKIGDSKRGVPRPPEVVAGMRNRMLGVSRTKESCTKQSETLTGKKRGPYRKESTS